MSVLLAARLRGLRLHIQTTRSFWSGPCTPSFFVVEPRNEEFLPNLNGATAFVYLTSRTNINVVEPEIFHPGVQDELDEQVAKGLHLKESDLLITSYGIISEVPYLNFIVALNDDKFARTHNYISGHLHNDVCLSVNGKFGCLRPEDLEYPHAPSKTQFIGGESVFTSGDFPVSMFAVEN